MLPYLASPYNTITRTYIILFLRSVSHDIMLHGIRSDQRSPHMVHMVRMRVIH